MPADYVIDAQNRIVHSRAWGEFTEADVHDHRKRLTTDPLFDSTFRQLADFSAVTRLSLTYASVHALTCTDPWDANSRRAFVAPADAVFGMARMYEMLLDGHKGNIAVFRRTEEAERWLRVDEG